MEAPSSDDDGEDPVFAAQATAAAMKAGEGDDALFKSLKMDQYDDEEDGAAVFLGGRSLAMYASNADDPLLRDDPDLGDVDSDVEDMELKAEDAILIVGRSDEERNRLEVYVYEEESCNLFVHHDFEVPAFPLSLAWMNVNPRGAGTSLI
jgi:periodic tryptophan protein 1